MAAHLCQHLPLRAPTPAEATTYNVDGGQKFPSGFLDPGAAALAKIWPKANITPGASVCNGCNYP